MKPDQPPQLILIRGMPGSGKTTIAKTLTDYTLVEADTYHIDDDGVYRYKTLNKQAAHNWCLATATDLLAKGERVVVANTFSRLHQMTPYLALGLPTGIIEADGSYESIHDLPPTTVARMRRFWQNLPPRLIQLLIKPDLTPATQRIDPTDALLNPAGTESALDQATLLLDQDSQPVYTKAMPAARSFRRQSKARLLRLQNRDTLLADIGPPLKPGETAHCISDGVTDFWDYTRVFLAWAGKTKAFYGITWVINRENLTDLLELIDDRTIEHATLITGDFFKRRDTATFSLAMTGLAKRKCRFTTAHVHAKIIALANPRKRLYLIAEGSANFTKNPRIEQFTLTNDKALYDFYVQWLKELISS